jgi:hypothetical protein
MAIPLFVVDAFTDTAFAGSSAGCACFSVRAMSVGCRRSLRI